MSENSAEIARLKSRIESLEAELARYRAVDRQSGNGSFWEALVYSRPILKSFLDHTTYGVAVKDRDLRVRFANPALQRMLGRSEESILMKSSIDFLGAEDTQQLEEDDRWVLANGDHIVRELRTTQNGREMHVRVHKSPIIDCNDNLAGIFIAVVDLKELESITGYKPGQSQLIPICSSCKKIRDDQGRWLPMETYLMTHWKTGPTHTICPECAKVLYPNLNLKLVP